MRGVGTLALVESATQLLNVLEWGHRTGLSGGLRVVVLPPRDHHPLRQVKRVAALAAEAGVDVRIDPVREPHAGAVSAGLRVARDVALAPRLVVGDPFSRAIQTVLPLSRAEDVVVVDDGTATWRFRDCVDSGAPLVRWTVFAGTPARRAQRATSLLSPSTGRSLEVFTCLEGAVPIGARHTVNRYTWTRSAGRPEITAGETDVLGVSLVDSGVIERRAYVAAVARIARRHGRVRYVAHRRESENLVAEIATIPGLRVLRPDLPVELALRHGPVAERVITFPSTAAHTMPVVLADLPVDFQVRHVDTAWFRPGTTLQARRFVGRIATDAHLAPELESA